MRDLNVRRLEMCVRSNGFLTENPPDFAKGSLGAQLVKRLDSAVADIKELSAARASEQNSALGQTANRVVAREALHDAMGKISRCARAMAITTPGLESSFRMPTREGELALLESAQAFVRNAEPVKSEFIKFEMPATFIDDLNARVKALEQAIVDHSERRSSHVAGTQAIDDAMAAALEILVQLDPILENKLAGDPILLHKWENARHVERAFKSKPDKSNGDGKTGVAQAAP